MTHSTPKRVPPTMTVSFLHDNSHLIPEAQVNIVAENTKTSKTYKIHIPKHYKQVYSHYVLYESHENDKIPDPLDQNRIVCRFDTMDLTKDAQDSTNYLYTCKSARTSLFSGSNHKRVVYTLISCATANNYDTKCKMDIVYSAYIFSKKVHAENMVARLKKKMLEDAAQTLSNSENTTTITTTMDSNIPGDDENWKAFLK